MSIGANTLVIGAVLGFDITASNNVTLQFQSGFPPTPVSTGTPVAGYTLPPSAPIIGPVPSNMPISLAVVLPVNDNAGLQTFIQEVTDPTNSMYRSYMSISTFAMKHGDDPTEYGKVAPWANSFGLTATTYANNLLVDVQGTAAQIEQALNANLVLALRSDGTVFYEPDRLPRPSVPTAVDAIQLMDTYAEPQPAQTIPNPQSNNGGTLFGSSDLRTAYLGIGTTCSTLTGAGQAIGIVAFDAFTQLGTIGPDGGVETDDITTYEAETGLVNCNTNGGALPCTPYPKLITVNTPPVFPPNGTNAGPAMPSGNTGSSEAALDVEMAMAMAPGAQIVNVEGQSIDSVLSTLATTPNLDQISNSWLNRSSTSQRFLDEFAAQGQSYFQGSGDGGEYNQTAQPCTCPCATPGSGVATTETLFTCGSNQCQSVCGPLPEGGIDAALSPEAGPPALVCVNGFAPPLDGQLTDMRASNEITLVGGTVLTTCAGASSATGICAGNAAFSQSYSSEQAWPSGGGGLIPGTPLPDFQQNVTTLVSNAGRNSPDVSIVATGLFLVSTGCGPTTTADGGAVPTNFVNGRCPAAQLAPGQAGPGSGTSAAAPLWAGFMALMNQQGASQTPPLQPIGYPNEAFYALLTTDNGAGYPVAFHDIQGGQTNSNECSLAPTPGAGWDEATGLGTPNGCSMIAAINALASPPQVTVSWTGAQFTTTGFNICTAANNLAPVPDGSLTCSPVVGPDGGLSAGTASEEVACGNGHGAFISVTCSPSASFAPGPALGPDSGPDAALTGNGATSRGIDVTVTASLEHNCGDNTPIDSNSFVVTDVIPGEPQGGSAQACDFFGGNCPLVANGGACTFNGFFLNNVTVTNTGGFFRSP